MKRYSYQIVLLFSFVSAHGNPPQLIITTTTETTQTNQSKEDMGSVVLHHFSQIVSHFFNIVKDPKDSKNVGQNVTGILANVVTIAAQAFKSGELSLDATPDEILAYAQEKSDLLRAPIMCMSRGKMQSMHMIDPMGNPSV